MISLRESILSKKASQMDINDIASSDNIKNLLWPDANKHQMEDWEFKYETPNLTCSHKGIQCSLTFNNYTITKLKEIGITNIKFDKTPRHVKIDLECTDCGGIEFHGNEQLEDLSVNVTHNCGNLKIFGERVKFECVTTKSCTIQNINISCRSLYTSVDGFNSNSKITTDAQNIYFGDCMYDRQKELKVKLFKANGDPIDSKFDKQKVDLIKILGLDIFDFTNKNPKIQINTNSPRSNYDLYPTIARKKPMYGFDFSYELANGWYLLV